MEDPAVSGAHSMRDAQPLIGTEPGHDLGLETIANPVGVAALAFNLEATRNRVHNPQPRDRQRFVVFHRHHDLDGVANHHAPARDARVVAQIEQSEMGPQPTESNHAQHENARRGHQRASGHHASQGQHHQQQHHPVSDDEA